MTTLNAFRDPVLQARFDREGYAVVPLVDPAEVERLSHEVARLCPVEWVSNIFDQWTYLSIFDRQRRGAISDFVKAALTPAIARLMTGVRVETGLVFQRRAGAEALTPHQHPPGMADFTDGMVCWCPLFDCKEGSGALQVIPRSHGLLRHVLTPSTPYAWQELPDEISRRLVTLTLCPGEAVFFAESLIHGSGPNRRDRTRIALLAHVMREDATPAFFADSEEREGWVDIYRAQDEFAQGDLPSGWLPPRETWERLGTMPANRVTLNRQQFDALLASDVKVAPGVDPYLAVAHLADSPAPARPQHGLLYRFAARHTPKRVKARLRSLV